MIANRLTLPWWALRVGLGGAAFLAGLDKFFNILADWTAYLSPLVANLLPIGASTFMHLIGVIEIAGAWLLLIAATLVTTGRFFDVAVRDVEMAIAAFTLARLTEAGVGATVGERVAATPRNSIRQATV
jgi:hypothetical protein